MNKKVGEGVAETLDYTQLSEKIFKISVNVLFSNGDGLDISPYIKRTRITNDYVNSVMPQFRMVFMLPLDVIMLIQKDKDQVVFSTEILYSAVNLADEASSNTDIKSFESYLKPTILKPLLLDDSLYNSTQLAHPAKDTEENAGSATQIKFELIAVPEDALKSNKYVTSGVYRKCNITEAILALTTKTNFKVHIIEPDNKQMYEQVILYPGNVYSNLYHLHNTYGIYNDDLKIYSVGDKLIISPLNSDKVLDNRSPIDINIEFDKTKAGGFLNKGSYEEVDPETLKTIKHIVTNHNNVAIRNTTGLIAEVFGTDSVMTSRNVGGLTETEYQSDYYDRNGLIAKTKVYEDIYNNQYSRTNFLNKIRNQNIVTIRYENIDLMMDDGLRKFILNFNNADYDLHNGEYKCFSTTHEFITQTKGLTTITGSISLRKI